MVYANTLKQCIKQLYCIVTVSKSRPITTIIYQMKKKIQQQQQRTTVHRFAFGKNGILHE